MFRISVALLALVCLPHLANARDFRSADVHPRDYPTVQAVTRMGSILKEKTSGKHTVRVFAEAALGSEKDTLEMVRTGTLDMARVNISGFTESVPETLAAALPFVFRSQTHMRGVLDGPIGAEILAALDAKGFVGLAFYDSGARSLYTTSKPVRRVADLKGMRVRVQQSEMWTALIDALGATPTPLPYAEVGTALRSGIIDAAENNFPSFDSSKHFEVAKFYSLTEHSMAPEILVFSKRGWDRLTREDQDAIRAAARESVPFMRQLWDAREATARKAVEAAGVTIITDIDRTSFAAAVKPVHARFAADPKIQSLIARIAAAQ